MDEFEKMKKEAAIQAVSEVENGMIVGLGSGSTAEYAIKEIGRRVEDEKLSIKAIPTSVRTQKVATNEGIKLTSFDDGLPDITIDGADAIGKNFLIKGNGGALTREKIVAYASKRFLVVVDERKLNQTNQRPKVPVEVLPFSLGFVLAKLFNYGSVEIRMDGNENFVTDNGNYIVDVYHQKRVKPEWEAEINSITGVIANGIFTKECDVFAGTQDGVKKIKF